MPGGNLKSSLVAMVIAATGQVTARADTLQVRGHLTIRNTSNEPSTRNIVSDLPGGSEFVLTIVDAENAAPFVGRLALTPSFWPEPGESFSGPFTINMRNPHPERIDEEPLLVDGMRFFLVIRAFVEPTRLGIDGQEYQPTIRAAVVLPAPGVPANADIRGGIQTRDSQPKVGEAIFRVDTIVVVPLADRADVDGDGDVDLADYFEFVSCFTGANTQVGFAGADNVVGLGCQDADLDVDGDVDLADLIAFQAAFTGPQ
jgi:hypothetical protein